MFSSFVDKLFKHRWFAFFRFDLYFFFSAEILALPLFYNYSQNFNINKSVISTLLDFSPTAPPPPPPPNQLYCVVCFVVLTLGWILHCPRKFTRAKININQTCARSVVSCLSVLFREHLLHSPPADHINISFINLT